MKCVEAGKLDDRTHVTPTDCKHWAPHCSPTVAQAPAPLLPFVADLSDRELIVQQAGFVVGFGLFWTCCIRVVVDLQYSSYSLLLVCAYP